MALSNAKSTERLTPYSALLKDLSENPVVMNEVTMGKRIGFYKIQQKLGGGAFGKVMQGLHSLVKIKVAIKILNKISMDEKTMEMTMEEIEVTKNLAHPHIIRLLEILETQSHIYLISEFAMSGDLYGKVCDEGKLTDPVAKRYFSQILSGLSYLHRSNIVHRDIKPHNIMITVGDTCKLADFGFSKALSSADDPLTTFCGSPPYAAPELFKDAEYSGASVDIWALGVMLYYCLVGQTPFAAPNMGALKRTILACSYTIPGDISQCSKFLISGILKPDPRSRFTLIEIMRSQWMAGEIFIGPLRSNRFKPPPNDDSLDDLERTALKMVYSYGITDEIIQECPENSLRNEINGTYRLAFFSEEKQNWRKKVKNDAEELERRKMSLLNKEQRNPAINPVRNPVTKICTVL